MAGFVLPLAQTILGGVSALKGASASKRATNLGTIAAERLRSEASPNAMDQEGDSRLRALAVARLSGRDPALTTAAERSATVRRNQEGLTIEQGRQELRDELARRGLLGTEKGRAELARYEQNVARGREASERTDEAQRTQLAQGQIQSGIEMLTNLLNNSYRNRALLSQLPVGEQVQAGAASQGAQGWSSLGGELLGRGLSGLTPFFNNLNLGGAAVPQPAVAAPAGGVQAPAVSIADLVGYIPTAPIAPTSGLNLNFGRF